MLLDLNPRSRIGERINYFVDRGIEAEAANEKPRDYLGCSIVGGSCERAVLYEAYRAQGAGITIGGSASSKAVGAGTDPLCVHAPSAHISRIFRRGHVMEREAASWVRLAGFVLATENPSTGEQFEVVLANGKLKGHADGILCHFLAPETCPIELPALWECKCLAHKYVQEIRRNHLHKARPMYYTQMQLYMYGLNLKQGLITCVDADTMDLYHELIDYDQNAVDKALQRVERVFMAVNAGEILPRGETSPAALACKLCRWNNLCWGNQ